MTNPFQTPTAIICPLCRKEFLKPEPPAIDPRGIDMVLGLAPGTMSSQAMYQALDKLEKDLKAHFEIEHQIEEWVEAVVKREMLIRLIHTTLSRDHSYGRIEEILKNAGRPIVREKQQ